MGHRFKRIIYAVYLLLPLAFNYSAINEINMQICDKKVTNGDFKSCDVAGKV